MYTVLWTRHGLRHSFGPFRLESKEATQVRKVRRASSSALSRSPRIARVIARAAVAAGVAALAVSSTAAARTVARAAQSASCTNNTLVQTNKGPVCGLTGVNYDQWLGIPYAAPPVGQLRWHSPRPHAAWSDPLQAGQAGSACPQAGGASPSTNEDCLFLNVTVPTGVGSGPLPVLVYIRGRGFQSGATSLYPEMQLAAQRRVIVVGVQYRLGVLGFLAKAALGRHAGDYGLQDQQAAAEMGAAQHRRLRR